MCLRQSESCYIIIRDIECVPPGQKRECRCNRSRQDIQDNYSELGHGDDHARDGDQGIVPGDAEAQRGRRCLPVLKTMFDERYDPFRTCNVGRNFGVHVTH